MGTLYVATSKALSEWAADVGLGKNVYKVGYVEDGTPEDHLAGNAGQTDWKVIKAEEVDGLDEAAMLEKLARKEKLADPNYYPRLKGATGIVRANIVAIENAMLVAIALENRDPPKNFKVKPADVAAYFIKNLK
ncbi:MAG: hypothetical protein ACM31L_12865 [Actinomycetota bacterium]